MGLGLLASPILSGSASAGLITCAIDPVLTLSDGTQLQISATVNDDPSDIQSVTYEVHGPKGTAMTGLSFPNDPLSYLESVTYVPDGPAPKYSARTTVTTGLSGVTVSASMTATNPTSGSQGSGTVAGLSGQTMYLTIMPK
jgi:hypothetical protein